MDATSISTFGINAKDNDNAIGFFGTGLKYAIAVILREGCEIVIRSGGYVFEFNTVDKTIRDKCFKVIHMNGMPLGFTTELGKNWKMWQAFRELYCNALDEGGDVQSGTIAFCDNHDSESTVVAVSGEKFHDIYESKNNIVLESSPFIKTDACDIHHGESGYIYYKGVRIYDGFARSMFTYNIKSNLDITEDRTARYEHQMRYKIVTAIAKSVDVKFIQSVICPVKNSFEHGILDYDEVQGTPSDTFLDVAESLRLSKDLNISVLRLLAKHRRIPEPERIELTDVQQKMLSRAISFCCTIGYKVDVYPIIVSAELRGGIHGMADGNIIYIAKDTFGHGTKYLAATLIEEYLHIYTGHADETRQLQNYLFNEIVSLGERIIGEPV